jgi:hypothetical protein
MREYIVESHLAQRKLNVVRVRCKVLQSMETLPQAPKCLAQILLLTLVVATTGVHAPVMDAATETELDVGGASRPVATLVRDVVLHARLRIDIELDLTDRASQALVKLTRIFIVGIIFRVTRTKTLAQDKHTKAVI